METKQLEVIAVEKSDHGEKELIPDSKEAALITHQRTPITNVNAENMNSNIIYGTTEQYVKSSKRRGGNLFTQIFFEQG